MRIDIARPDAVELHRYVQSLIDAWPDNPETWTTEQCAVASAFLQLETSLDRVGALSASDKGSQKP